MRILDQSAASGDERDVWMLVELSIREKGEPSQGIVILSA